MPSVHRVDRSLPVAATLLVAILFTLLPAGTAHACSCMFMTAEEALQQGNVPAAFVGTLESRQEAGGGDFGPQFAWTFEVEAVLAGELDATTAVTAPADDGANCGLNLQEGDRVGLILYSDGDGWSSSSCSTYDADELLAAGDPQPPTDSGSGEPVAQPPNDASSSVPVVPIGLAVLAAAGILAAVVLLARRGRPADG